MLTRRLLRTHTADSLSGEGGVKAPEVELIYQLRILLELIMYSTISGICPTTHCMVFIYEYLHLLYRNLLSK